LQHLAEETPQPPVSQRQASSYFGQAGGNSNNTFSSGDDEDSSRENSFGAMGALPERKKPITTKKDTTEDLIRRGSVDERTMTMGRSVRLFVANPDLSD
jgi:hypothetical protein